MLVANARQFGEARHLKVLLFDRKEIALAKSRTMEDSIQQAEKNSCNKKRG